MIKLLSNQGNQTKRRDHFTLNHWEKCLSQCSLSVGKKCRITSTLGWWGDNWYNYIGITKQVLHVHILQPSNSNLRYISWRNSYINNISQGTYSSVYNGKKQNLNPYKYPLTVM